MESYPRASSLTSLSDIRFIRRMSAPVTTTVRRSSPVSASIPTSFRRLSLADIPVPRSSRKLSLVECSTTTNGHSESSVEIDTSSLSYDLPATGPSYAGSYQPIPRVAASRHSPGLLTFITTNRPVWRALVLGQVMSLVLCFMAVCNHCLSAWYQIGLPTGQSTLHYILQCLLFTTWLSCRSGNRGIISVLRRRGWRYLLLALVDIEANYLLVTAHQFTTLTSIQLLDCVSVTAALALSCLVLKVRYKIVHIVGVSVCLMGVGCLVWADIDDGRSLTGGKNQLLGDLLCLGGAVLFAVVSVTQELVVKTHDWVEYLGMVGLFGSVISIVQTAVLERNAVLLVPWSTWQVVGLLLGFGFAKFLFCVLSPVVLRDSGATALHLSLLTADFYWLVLGIILLQYKFHALYFLSFALTATGIIIYAVKRTPIFTQSQQPATYSALSFPSFEESQTKESCQETTPLHLTWS